MAASYSTGVSTDPVDLLQDIVAWLSAQGWTTDQSASDGSGWRAHLHKGSLYVNMRAAMNEKIFGTGDFQAGYGIGLYLGTGYSGAAAWNAQAGRPTTNAGTVTGAGMNLSSGAISAYHFFDDGNDQITIVVEKSSGIFVHMGWGPKLVRTGSVEDFWFFFGSTTAQYVTSTSVFGAGMSSTAHAPMAHSWGHATNADGNGFVRVDATTWANRWVSNSTVVTSITDADAWTGRDGRCSLNEDDTHDTQVNTGEYPCYKLIRDRSHQSAFVGAMILPLHFFVRTDPAARWAPVGYPPTVFYCDAVGHGFGHTEVYQVGGLNYMVFPSFAVRKAA